MLILAALLTQAGYKIIINSSLLLYDNDYYDANNHYFCLWRDTKDNNNATAESKDQVKSIDLIEETFNYLECHSSSLTKGIVCSRHNNYDTMNDPMWYSNSTPQIVL